MVGLLNFYLILLHLQMTPAGLLIPYTVSSFQDLLPELQTVCQCCEAVLPPAAPVEVNPTLEAESEPENTPEAKPVPGTKRKRSRKDATGPPAKKILGDGTRLPSTPVSWRSSSNGIVIKFVSFQEQTEAFD